MKGLILKSVFLEVPCPESAKNQKTAAAAASAWRVISAHLPSLTSALSTIHEPPMAATTISELKPGTRRLARMWSIMGWPEGVRKPAVLTMEMRVCLVTGGGRLPCGRDRNRG